MQIVMPWQKTCPNCEEYMKATIFVSPDINPREVGNPWKCEKCDEIFVCKDGLSYMEHIEIVKKYYLKEKGK